MSIYLLAPWLKDNRYGGKKKLVLLAVAEAVNHDGVGFLSQRQMMEWSGSTEAYVSRCIKEFSEDGILTVLEKGTGPGKATVYRLNPPTEYGSEAGTNPHTAEGGNPHTGNGNPHTPHEVHPSFTTALTVNADFAAWYQKYPRKEAPKAARAAYDKAIKGGATHADLDAGLDRQIAVWKADGTEKKFIPHPATWLNQGRWMSDLGAGQPAEPQQVDLTANPDVCKDCLTYVKGKDQHLCVALGEPYIRIHAEAGDGRAA